MTIRPLTLARRLALATGVACAALLPPALGAAEAPTGASDGLARSSLTSQAAIGAVRPSLTFENASLGAGGVGLRNRGAGGIEVAGMSGTPRAAYVYWSVIVSGDTPGVDKIDIQRSYPLPASGAQRLTGTLVGTGATPCWGGSGIRVYRAAVPTTLASGNGQYIVSPIPGAAGRTDGASPWAGVSYPLWEGASLAVVGSGSAAVSFYDQRLAGATFSGDLTYVLRLPRSTSGASEVMLHQIGADGQHTNGAGHTDILGLSKEFVRVNGVRVSGPGSQGYDSAWNGDAGGAYTQLWDHAVHNITAAAYSGPVRTDLRVGHFTNSSGNRDCLTPVANIVSIR